MVLGGALRLGLLTGLLALIACSGEELTPPIPDTGTGGVQDAGPSNLCVPGRSEACACLDGRSGAQTCQDDGTFAPCECADAPDAGPVDTGPMSRLGTEGYPPAIRADCQGSSDPSCCEDAPDGNLGCVDPALTCFRASASFEDVEAEISRVCLRLCENDLDCDASPDNRMCREIRFGADACVSDEVAEGEIANLSRVRGPLTGCSADLSEGGTYLVGIAYYVGSGLWELAHDQSSCARQCDPGDPTDCTAVAPHCTAPFFNSTERPGVCTKGQKRAGAPCSRMDGTEMCSRDPADGRLVCWDYLGQYDDPGRGTCHQLCSIADQDCSNAHAPEQRPVCLDVLTTSTITGMCSDGCGRHPETCEGLGSDQPEGGAGLGMNCHYGFFRDSDATIDAPDVAFCYDIVTPVLDIWDFTAQGASCDDARTSCPDGAFCENDGTTNDAYCVYGCTTSSTAMQSGCEIRGAGHEVCRKAGDVQFDAGFCAPF